ncbi:MAG: hypothetical protein ABIR81_04955 [Ginsengibacter sp.]
MKTIVPFLKISIIGIMLSSMSAIAFAQSGKTDINKTRRLADGTTIYSDGTVKRPDGTVKYSDGRVRKPDGSVRYPDGTIKHSNNNLQNEKWIPPGHTKKLDEEKSAKKFTPGQKEK